MYRRRALLSLITYKPSIPNNEIWYTSSDGNVVKPHTNNFGANVVSNNYINGRGIISFDGPIVLIDDWTFNDCNSLTSVNIPDSVTEIGESAFRSCDSLTSVTIGDGVTTIGSHAFAYCASLINVTIGDGVVEIGDSTFYYCTSLTSVNIPDSVTTIESSAFSNCTSLASVNIGNNVTTIGYYAFYNCDSLTNINIPDSVTEIGYSAFYVCEILTHVTIGKGITSIGMGAFRDCPNLTNVNCKAAIPPSLSIFVFDGNSSGRKIYVPVGSVNAYKSATRWSEYADAIEGYDFRDDGLEEIFPATIYPHNTTSGDNIINYNIAKYFINTYPNVVVGNSGSNYTPITEDVTIDGSNACDGKVLGVKKFSSSPEYEAVLFYTQNSINNLHALKVITDYLNTSKGTTEEWFFD